jgi:hypothetical protein
MWLVKMISQTSYFENFKGVLNYNVLTTNAVSNALHAHMHQVPLIGSRCPCQKQLAGVSVTAASRVLLEE